jgi:hypothetical protein
MKAVGEYVILKMAETISTSGLITAKEYIVDSVGSLVPLEIGCGDTVLFNGDKIEMTLDDGRVCMHYDNILAFDAEEVPYYIGGEEYYGEEPDFL